MIQKFCDSQTINDAHNEGYDVGYWAGRRDYEPKWILCSERLPEEDYETGNGVQFSADVLATIVNHKNDGELYVWLLKTVDGKWYDYIPNENGMHEVPYWCEVIAWMPLPAPYREEGGKQ